MRVTKIPFAIAWVLVLSLLPSSASADPLAPSLLELREMETGLVQVRWKTPLRKLRGLDVRPNFPEQCRQVTAATDEPRAAARISRWAMDCGPDGLAGLEIGIEGLEEAGTSVLLRVEGEGARSTRAILRGSAPTFEIPEALRTQSKLEVGQAYLALGFTHILTGTDHLIFVLGLLLIITGWRALFATVTAFTLGHSVTLSLASLGLIGLPQAPVEAAIAFSILLVAVEISRGKSHPSLLRRHPWGVAGSIGLLHGLGFAGALAEVGLPVGEIPLALITFNVGIEAGQLLFIAALVTVKIAAGHLSMPSWLANPRAVAYLIGPLAALWSYERTILVLLAGG